MTNHVEISSDDSMSAEMDNDSVSTEMDIRHQGTDLGSRNGRGAATAAYIQNKLNKVTAELAAAGGGEEAVIYRVPESLRASNTEAYKPKLISIGPYHHGSPDLQPMETSKCAVLKDLCELTGVSLARLVDSLDQEVKDPKKYYRQKIDMVVGDEALLALLLIDGCFLFSYLAGLQRFAAVSSSSSPAQPAPHVYSVDSSIHHDILLLENQVPYPVLKAVGSAVCQAHHIHRTNSVDELINKLASGFIKGVFQYIPTAAQPKGFDHLVDLCYQFLCPSSLTTCEGQEAEQPDISRYQLEIPISQCADESHEAQQPFLRRLRRATEYRETGIRLKPRRFVPKEPISLLDITFSRGVLQIPRLVVDERTDYLLRNIVAYEQESFDSQGSYVTAYVLFMSQLMSKAEDVTLLSEKDILVHQLGSDEEVSDMFKKMSKGVVFDFNGEYHLKDVTVALERHYRDRRNRWMALLRHTYFSNPWLILGAVVAMVAFALSVSQAALNFRRFARDRK